MPGGPFPAKWRDRLVAVEVASGSDFVGRVIGSNEGGCVIVREVVEGDNPEPVARQYLYPWSSIRSIKLLDEPEGEDDELLMGGAW
jgi:hypothetical protein